MCKIKKIVSLIIVACIVITIFPTVNSEKYIASEKVGEEYTIKVGVSIPTEDDRAINYGVAWR